MSKVTISLKRDVEYFDSVIRTPGIYDRISQDSSPFAQKISVAALEKNPRNIFVTVLVDGTRAGFFMGLQKLAGTYEVHTNLTCAGADALAGAAAATRYMFTHTDCQKLFSFCPGNHREVQAFALKAGMKLDWLRPDAWRKGEKDYSLTYVSQTISEWVRLHWREFVPLGQKFHTALFAQLPGDEHAEDENHDGMVGLTLYTAVIGKQPTKAQAIYNSWAAIAGYAPVKFLGEQKGFLGADIGTAVLAIDPQLNIKVKKCHQP